MWIGSPLRGAFRLVSYLLVTLVLVPIYLLAMALRIRPAIRGGSRLKCRLGKSPVAEVHEMKTEAIPIVNRGREPKLATSRITVQDLLPFYREGATNDDHLSIEERKGLLFAKLARRHAAS